MTKKPSLKSGKILGKYRLRSRLGEGGYGEVWRAEDTVEGIHVALKIPFEHFTDKESLETFRHEAKLLAKLDHPNILRIKTAEFINGHFVIASELGQGTLAKVCKRALSLKRSLFFFQQVLDAVAYAHEKKLLHRDIKPENFILFQKEHLRLGDFGITQILQSNNQTSTISGTLGYMAPEQAYGQPTKASDVFSTGLILWWMLTGRMAYWPFEWPFEGYDILQKKTPAILENFLRKACSFKPKDRFSDVIEMRTRFHQILPKILREEKRKKKKGQPKHQRKKKKIEWHHLRTKEFERKVGKKLELFYECRNCHHPISEAMKFCPWCKSSKNRFDKVTHYSDTCEGCHKGVKDEWRYCPWCFGPGFTSYSDRIARDKRYTHRCTNKNCDVGLLMPFMRYCPWCHKKAKRTGHHSALAEKCPKCRWSVSKGYWDYCPWCGNAFKG